MHSIDPAFRLSSSSVAQVHAGVRPNRGRVRLAEIPAWPADATAEQMSVAGSTPVAVPMMSPANVTQALSSHRVMLALGLLIVFAVQLPAFTYFFYNDDYVPFAEIVDNGIPRYLSNLILVQDITPNWRVVPGLIYLAGYETFGMQALPYHIVSMACHLGTCALLYHITRRATGLATRRWNEVASDRHRSAKLRSDGTPARRARHSPIRIMPPTTMRNSSLDAGRV